MEWVRLVPGQNVIKIVKKPPGPGGIELCPPAPEGEDRCDARTSMSVAKLERMYTISNFSLLGPFVGCYGSSQSYPSTSPLCGG